MHLISGSVLRSRKSPEVAVVFPRRTFIVDTPHQTCTARAHKCSLTFLSRKQFVTVRVNLRPSHAFCFEGFLAISKVGLLQGSVRGLQGLCRMVLANCLPDVVDT